MEMSIVSEGAVAGREFNRALRDLTRRADEALVDGNRNRCLEVIEAIYKLLDLASSAAMKKRS